MKVRLGQNGKKEMEVFCCHSPTGTGTLGSHAAQTGDERYSLLIGECHFLQPIIEPLLRLQIQI